MYLDEKVKEAAETRLERSIPNPAHPEFDTLILELYDSAPALAEALQRGIIYENAGDPRDAARKSDAQAQRKQAAFAFAFQRRDRFTGEWVEARNKTAFWVILALMLCAFAALWYQRASTAAAFRQPVSAQQASIQGATTEGAVTGGVTGGEPSEATVSLEPASTSFNLRASLDEFSAAQVSGGSGETAPTGGAPVETPVPAPAPAPAPEAEPIESAIVLERADTPSETIAFARPEQEGSDVLRSAPTQTSSSAVAYRAGAPAGETQGGGGGGGSAIVFQRDPSTSSAPAPQDGGETQTDPFQQTLDTPVPFYEQPTAAQAQGGAAGQGAPAYAPGETLEASLDTEIATPPGESITAFARAADGSSWQGQAALNQLGRVEVTFTLLQNGAPAPTTAIAYGLDDKLGLDATVRNEAPNIAADLVGAALRGVTQHAEALSENQSIVQNGETVVVQDQATPLEWAIAGSAAELFSPPEQERSLVRVGEVPAGTPFTLRVTGQ